MKRVNCISSPRNISTALMYSFAQLDDTVVYDEPFYAFYLNLTEKSHPGRDDILKSQPHSYEEVFDNLKRNTCRLLYVKNMAHQMRFIPLENFENYTNVLLIRNPSQLIASFAQIIKNPDIFDIGIAEQFRIWKYFIENGHDVVVVDSGELLANPSRVMRELCDRIEMPFNNSMLTWEAGGRPEDGVWAQHWYKNVHKSTGFAKQQSSSRPFPERCRELLAEALPLYEQLYCHAIKAQ